MLIPLLIYTIFSKNPQGTQIRCRRGKLEEAQKTSLPLTIKSMSVQWTGGIRAPPTYVNSPPPRTLDTPPLRNLPKSRNCNLDIRNRSFKRTYDVLYNRT